MILNIVGTASHLFFVFNTKPQLETSSSTGNLMREGEHQLIQLSSWEDVEKISVYLRALIFGQIIELRGLKNITTVGKNVHFSMNYLYQHF